MNPLKIWKITTRKCISYKSHLWGWSCISDRS